MNIKRKASVPQSKACDMLDGLGEKGFLELSTAERPKKYRARVLEEVADFTIGQRQKESQELERHQEKLNEILRSIAPLHQKYNGLRFSRHHTGGD